MMIPDHVPRIEGLDSQQGFRSPSGRSRPSSRQFLRGREPAGGASWRLVVDPLPPASVTRATFVDPAALARRQFGLSPRSWRRRSLRPSSAAIAGLRSLVASSSSDQRVFTFPPRRVEPSSAPASAASAPRAPQKPAHRRVLVLDGLRRRHARGEWLAQAPGLRRQDARYQPARRIRSLPGTETPSPRLENSSPERHDRPGRPTVRARVGTSPGSSPDASLV